MIRHVGEALVCTTCMEALSGQHLLQLYRAGASVAAGASSGTGAAAASGLGLTASSNAKSLRMLIRPNSPPFCTSCVRPRVLLPSTAMALMSMAAPVQGTARGEPARGEPRH